VTPIRKKLIDLRACLDKILEAPLETQTSIKAQVAQSLIMDKNGAEALAALSKDIDGNVFLVQSATINAQVIKQGAAALRTVTEIERLCYENGVSMDQVLEGLIKKGWRLPEIEKMVREKCFKIMERKKLSGAESAKRLGIKRTTFVEQKKRLANEQ